MKTHRIRRNMLYRLYMWCKAVRANIYFSFPGRGLHCYGITGTDGKSTTSELLYHVMKRSGMSVGILSTVSIDVGEGRVDNLTKLTSLSHRDFQKYLARARKNGVKHMVIEASSHALYQFRLRPIRCVGVGFTNLSHEHLDFHRTMEHYCRTKLRLFSDFATRDACKVLPADFGYDSLVAKYAGDETVRFGLTDDADIFATTIQNKPLLTFQLHYQGKTAQVDTLLHGRFNTDNMMIATALAMHAGVLWDDVIQGLQTFPGLPGRQEIIQTTNNIHIMIDFAVTPKGLETLYSAMKQCGYTRLIAVFGATGDRDTAKRPIMGKIAAQRCDRIVITEDENYTEDGQAIMQAIKQGVDEYLDERGNSDQRKNSDQRENPDHLDQHENPDHLDERENPDHPVDYTLIQDRSQAIHNAIQHAQPGDLIMITGMANFTTRAMNEGKIPRDEKKVILEGVEKAGLEVE